MLNEVDLRDIEMEEEMMAVSDGRCSRLQQVAGYSCWKISFLGAEGKGDFTVGWL